MKNWMSKISGGRRITEMAIPGTHDSGAYKEYTYTPMVQAQDHSIKQQLEAGVRALDIRCGPKTTGTTTSYEVFHGGYDQGLTVKGVCQEIVKFLEKNTSEFVILMLKQETAQSVDISAGINKIVSDEIHNKQRMYVRSNQWPKLKDVRGKVLVLSRLKRPARSHFDTREWTGNPARLSFENAGVKDGCGVIVQDRWKMPWLDYKQQVVKDLLKEAYLGSDNHYLFLNFMSAAWTLRDPLKTGRSDMNPWFRANIKFGKGVICVDGVNRDIAKSIVDLNYLVRLPDVTAENIIGKQCRKCSKIRQKISFFSTSGWWHVCSYCNSIYCDSCGKGLNTWSYSSRTRKCGNCSSQTTLV